LYAAPLAPGLVYHDAGSSLVWATTTGGTVSRSVVFGIIRLLAAVAIAALAVIAARPV